MHRSKLYLVSPKVLIIIILLIFDAARAVTKENEKTNNEISPNATSPEPINATKLKAKPTMLNTSHSSASDVDQFQYMITGGYRPETDNASKYIVSIQNETKEGHFGEGHFCSGTIIAPNMILTAAHCICKGKDKFHYKTKNLIVVSGTPNRFKKNTHTQVVKVKEQKPHSRFNPQAMINDIALLILENDLTLDNFTQVLRLPDADIKPRDKCVILGWGRIMDKGPTVAELLYGNVEIWPDKRCEATHKKHGPNIFCANHPSGDPVPACGEDAGGPLVCSNKLAGIASYGFICTENLPGYYTNVFRYIIYVMHQGNRGTCIKNNILTKYAIQLLFIAIHIL